MDKTALKQLPPENLYQMIGQAFLKCLPADWQSGTLEFVVEDHDVQDLSGTYINRSNKTDFVDLWDVDPIVWDCFLELASRMSDSDGQHWEKAIFWMNKQGEFKINYAYPAD